MATRHRTVKQSTVKQSNPKQTSVRAAASLAIASLLAILATGDNVLAASTHKDRSAEFVDSRTPAEPVLAVVSLPDQRITVYDQHGWVARAPVSTGQKGRETPAGVFSVIEKQAEHYSNLYDDAYMPHMQRITWSGIALHGGPLPGYAASHGCVRMPYDFATRLFGMTKLGMRVIVAPSDVAPVEISHPALFQPAPGVGAIAAARAAEAAEAVHNADQARAAVRTAIRDVAKATAKMRSAENQRAKAEAQYATLQNSAASADSAEALEGAEVDKAAAAARVAEADAKVAEAAAKVADINARVANAETELQPKLDALAAARDAAIEADAARATATQLAKESAQDLRPVSVFISRKTQRLYVRQGYQPILETPVIIADADRPIGTHVFTAMDRAGDGLQWSVVSLESEHRTSVTEEPTRPDGAPDAGPAKAALDRITIPQDVSDRLAGIVGPRSSLIISDEATSSETGKDTDFIVILSDEPQGGIKIRKREPEAARTDRPRGGPANWTAAPFVSRSYPW